MRQDEAVRHHLKYLRNRIRSDLPRLIHLVQVMSWVCSSYLLVDCGSANFEALIFEGPCRGVCDCVVYLASPLPSNGNERITNHEATNTMPTDSRVPIRCTFAHPLTFQTHNMCRSHDLQNRTLRISRR